ILTDSHIAGDGLGLREDVECAPARQQEFRTGERFEVPAHVAFRLAHTFGRGIELTLAVAVHREDAVRFPDIAAAQDDALGLIGTRPIAQGESSWRPSIARVSVTSSVYSRSAPLGRPRASRVTRTPAGTTSRWMYIEVASPSRLEFVAMMTSLTSPGRSRSMSSRMWSSSGPTPSIGLSTPWSTW